MCGDFTSGIIPFKIKYILKYNTFNIDFLLFSGHLFLTCYYSFKIKLDNKLGKVTL